MNEASTGLSTVVVLKVKELPAWWNGNLRFAYAILRAFVTYKNEYLKIKAGAFEWNGMALLIVAANGKYFGSGLAIAPEADLSDGLLDLTIVGDVSLMEYIRCLPLLRRGKRINHKHVMYLRAASVEVSGPGSIETDGEPGNAAICKISLAGKINVLK